MNKLREEIAGFCKAPKLALMQICSMSLKSRQDLVLEILRSMPRHNQLETLALIQRDTQNALTERQS
jgi:hypothetical protein